MRQMNWWITGSTWVTAHSRALGAFYLAQGQHLSLEPGGSVGGGGLGACVRQVRGTVGHAGKTGENGQSSGKVLGSIPWHLYGSDRRFPPAVTLEVPAPWLQSVLSGRMGQAPVPARGRALGTRPWDGP